MAPKKTKKPSMMQRQRQLSAQQQQVKRASSSKLPPGKKGGAVTKPPTATSKPSPIKPVRVRDLGPTKPKPLSGASQRALPPGRPGGAVTKPPAKPSAKPAAKPSSGLSGGLRSAAGYALLSGITAKTTDTLSKAANPKEWERVSQELKDRGYGSKPSPKPAKPAKPEGSVNRRGRGVAATPKPAAKPAAKPANVADYKDAQGNTYDGNSGRLKTAAKATPKPPAAPPKAPAAPSGPTRSKPAPKGSSSASKTSSSRNVGPVANGDDYARNKDPKKYNPLMQKTFGYQKGDAPDQRAKRANYSGTDTGVSPKSTGSKNYADKKTTNKTSTAFASGVELSPNKKKLKAKR